MIRLEWIFVMQAGMAILMILFLQKLTQMKKQVDDITREVKDYVAFVTEEEGEMQVVQEDFVQEKKSYQEKENKKKMSKREQEEVQNSLIQSVLGEYFP